MLTRKLFCVPASSLLWLLVAVPALAQHQNPYAASPYARPTVSPYLNLGVTRDGLSNYPTLVRPLIEDQNAIIQQAAHIQRLEQQLRQTQGGATDNSARDAKTGLAASDRFLNLSHYYRVVRNRETTAGTRR